MEFLKVKKGNRKFGLIGGCVRNEKSVPERRDKAAPRVEWGKSVLLTGAEAEGEPDEGIEEGKEIRLPWARKRMDDLAGTGRDIGPHTKDKP